MNGHQKGIMYLKEIVLVSSKIVKYSKFNSQHNQEDLYAPIRRKRIFPMHEIFI